jgi:hypothetical protein
MASDKDVARTSMDHLAGIARKGFLPHVRDISTQNDRAIAAIAAEPVEQSDELRQACFPPTAGWLVLLDNDWEQCVIDAVEMAEDILPGQMRPIWHGVDHICPGRHLVTTTVASGVAVLDTLVYPGELVAYRLDYGRAVWGRITGGEAEGLARSINGGKVRFQDYFARVARPRIAAYAARRREEVLVSVGAAFVDLVGRLDAGESPATVAPDATTMGRALVGLPLESFGRIAEPVGAIAWARASAGRLDLARLVVQLGLAWLPGESSLLAILAGFAAEEGNWDEALSVAKQARSHADPTWRAWLDALCARAPQP